MRLEVCGSEGPTLAFPGKCLGLCKAFLVGNVERFEEGGDRCVRHPRASELDHVKARSSLKTLSAGKILISQKLFPKRNDGTTGKLRNLFSMNAH